MSHSFYYGLLSPAYREAVDRYFLEHIHYQLYWDIPPFRPYKSAREWYQHVCDVVPDLAQKCFDYYKNSQYMC